MLCDNCGRNEANIRYWENINGKTKELNLCEECSQKLGINNLDLSMPINFTSFLGEFIEDFATPEFMPLLNQAKTLKCDNCGYTFKDIINTGKLGCANCYNVFDEKLDNIIKKIQGSNKHVGRLGKVIDNKIDKKIDGKNTKNEKSIQNTNKEEQKTTKNQLEELQEELKKAIKDERYEDAAKIRDEIKKIS